jgi:hypothetical protein
MRLIAVATLVAAMTASASVLGGDAVDYVCDGV